MITRFVRLSLGPLISVLFCCAISGTAQAQIAFTNASESHLNGRLSSESWGIAVGDINGDFWPDIFVNNHRNRPSLYQVNSQGTFDNVILQADPGYAFVGERYTDTHGAAFSDFDGDGDDDLVVGTNAAKFHYFLRSNNGVLSNEARRRLGVDTSSAFSMWFDYNGDGLTDLFQGRDSSGLSVYFTQDLAGGTFTGRGMQRLANCDGDWAMLTDINDDQRSDLVCHVEGSFPHGAYDLTDSSFNTKLTTSLPSVGNVVDSVAADFNNDLKSDLLLLRGALSASGAQQHGSNFVEISSDTGLNEKVIFSFTGGGTLTVKAWFPPVKIETTEVTGNRRVGGFDFNYDQTSDRWTVSRQTQTWEYAYLQIRGSKPISSVRNNRVSRRDRPIEPNLFRRSGGRWLDQTAAAGMNLPLECKAVVAADFDNDMDQDLYFVCGRGSANIKNRLFSNNGAGTFTEVANAGGAAGVTGAPIRDGVGSGENVVTADFNNDGFIDLFVVNGNNSQPVRGRVGPHELMLNKGNSNHWVELELIGTTTDPDGAGARVIATAGGVSQLRETGAIYHRWSQNHNRVHFGLGRNTRVNLEVQWPNGMREYFNSVAADSLYTVTQGQGVRRINLSSPKQFASAKAGDECGSSNYFRDMDTGIFISKDCASSRWRIRAIASVNETRSFSGRLTLSKPGTNIAGTSLEASDSLNASNSRDVAFTLKVSNTDEDGFDITIPANAKACLRLSSSSGQRGYLGRKHVPVRLPVDLNTLNGCNNSQNEPVLRANDITVSEGVGVATFNLTLSTPNRTSPVTLLAVAADVSTTQGQDYYGIGTRVTFAPGETAKSVAITVLDDSQAETSETLSLRLLDVAGAQVAPRQAMMTIVDNDNNNSSNAAPKITNPGDQVSNLNQPVTLRLAASDPNGDALSYSALRLPVGLSMSASGVISGTPTAQQDNTVVITVNDGRGKTAAATFQWKIGGSSTSSPKVSINDIAITERTRQAVFTVYLDRADASRTSRVKLVTQAVSASEGVDFNSLSQDITFAPGEMVKRVTVTLLDDTIDEANETVRLQLSSPKNLTISRSSGLLTIIDDD